ncbi:HAD family hydrolase [Haemophilus paracuniculus]|nr:HAD family hydrolase [Haemophilus paracuniculus]
MNKYVVFDLDDTLYNEIDFLYSAYKEIANYISPDANLFSKMKEKYHLSENVFDWLIAHYPNIEKQTLLKLYREHMPAISLSQETNEVLNFCKENDYLLGIITDGRSLTQRNKIIALGLDSIFQKIIISEEFGSEKPNPENYKVFMDNEYDIEKYIYIADNPRKDFLAPNKLGWDTVCLLDGGRNIHPQNFDQVSSEYLPKYKIQTISELKDLL